MSTRLSRPSSAKPSPSARRSSEKWGNDQMSHEDFITDCKAAYLVIFEDLSDDINSRSELQSVLQQAGRNPSKRVLEKYWDKQTDSLTFHDFVDICKKEPPTSENELIKAFRKIDLNGDGFITNDELMRVMTTKGEKMSKREVQDLIDEVDENNDGKLEYKEFCKMVMSTQNEVKKLAKRKLEKKVQTKSPRDRPLSARSGRSNDSFSRSNRSKTDSEKKESTSNSARMESLKHDSINSTNGVGEEDDDDDIVIGSQVSLNTPRTKPSETPKPKPRKSIKEKDSEPVDMPSPSPRRKGDSTSKSPIMGRKIKVYEPKDLKTWQHIHNRGGFFLEEDGTIVSHQYSLTLTEDTSIWITMQPFIPKSTESPHLSIDTMLFVLRERPDHDGNYLVTFTEQRDIKGRFCLRADLKAGRYLLKPFTTGCRLKKRHSEPKVETKLVKRGREENKFVLTKPFRDVLGEIFEMCDLDGNGLLNREEFNLFNLRTSGEEVADEEWEVVEENVELKKGQITKKGFLDLSQMEADDNEGDTEDLWVTLTSMGYNKSLVQDEGAGFVLDLYAEESDSAQLKVKGIESGGDKLIGAVCQSVISKGEATKIKGMKDLFLHTYVSEARACLVVENKSRSRVSVELDCSKSRNVVSNRKSLDHSVDVQSRSSVVGHHIFPANERQEWNLRCSEAVVK